MECVHTYLYMYCTIPRTKSRLAIRVFTFLVHCVNAKRLNYVRGMRQWSFSSRCCVNALQLPTREDCGKVQMNRLNEFGNIPEATT